MVAAGDAAASPANTFPNAIVARIGAALPQMNG